ncbi:DnaJ domain-containing protein [Xylaria scruposa]|nr:DnaJ domain-containing protein [Xylaria scruposa]
MNSETPNYYSTLEVQQGASKEELRAAYRRLARIHHPDKNKGNEEVATAKFQQLDEAFQTLIDPDKRFQYDQKWKQSYDQSNQQSYNWSYQPTTFPMQQPNAFPMQQPNAFPTQQPNAFPTQQPNAYPMQQPTAFPTQHNNYTFRETPQNTATASTNCSFCSRGICSCRSCHGRTRERRQRDRRSFYVRKFYQQFSTSIPSFRSSPASSPPPVYPQARPDSYQHNYGRGSTPMYSPGPVWHGDGGQPR